jgi:hypothetical protein
LLLWNEHALSDLPRLVGPGYVHHTISGIDDDIAGFLKGFAGVLEAFLTCATRS